MAKVRRIFPGGNTSLGFFSYHDNIVDMDRNMLYILKGMPGGGKSSLMREIGDNAAKKGFNVEFHHCPSDPQSIDGVVIVEQKIALVDGTAPHIIDPIYPGLIDTIIDLGKYVDRGILGLYKEEILSAKSRNKQSYRRAFNYFKASRFIYDEIEASNKENMDFNGVNKLTKTAIERIFSKDITNSNIDGFKERHLFSAAYTPEGLVDYTSTIIDGVKDRYFLNGNVGTGKTTFLKRIAEEARIRNFHTELFHNPMIPHKLDSLIIKELNTIISTTKETKNYIFTTIDLDEYFDSENLAYEDLIQYNSLIEKGVESLKGAKENHGILEAIYKKSIDYRGVTKEKDALWEEIMEKN